MVSRIGKKKGLSEVVSTLILLVVAVLLAAVVTYYATNITMVRTENEQLMFSKVHVWVTAPAPSALSSCRTWAEGTYSSTRSPLGGPMRRGPTSGSTGFQLAQPSPAT